MDHFAGYVISFIMQWQGLQCAAMGDYYDYMIFWEFHAYSSPGFSQFKLCYYFG